MPIVLFQAEQAAQGAVYRFVVAGPTLPAIQQWLLANPHGTPGMRYKPFLVQENPQAESQVICVEIAGPTLSAAHVQGGQPTAQPIGQRGRDVPPARRDFSGFETLQDAHLGLAGDAEVFGDPRDGTYCDLLSNGQEIPREPRAGSQPGAPR